MDNRFPLFEHLWIVFKLRVDRVRILSSCLSDIINSNHYQLTAHNLVTLHHCLEKRLKLLPGKNTDDGSNEIIFRSHEIHIRCLVRLGNRSSFGDSSQSSSYDVHFDDRHRLYRLLLEYQRPSSFSSSKDKSIKWGFIDLDLMEEWYNLINEQSKHNLKMMNRLKKAPMIRLNCSAINADNYPQMAELWYSIDCRPELARSSPLSSPTIQMCKFEQIKQELCKKMVAKNNNIELMKMRSNGISKSNDSIGRRKNSHDYPPMLDWIGRISSSLLDLKSSSRTPSYLEYRLYQIRIHFGYLDYIHILSNPEKTGDSIPDRLWACFQVKTNSNTSSNSTLSLGSRQRLRRRSFWKSSSKHTNSTIDCCTRVIYQNDNDQENYGSFGEHYQFYLKVPQQHLESTETTLSVMNVNKNISFHFRCPLMDYLEHPSRNQYFCLEADSEPLLLNESHKKIKKKGKFSSKSFCTLQFSINLQPVSLI